LIWGSRASLVFVSLMVKKEPWKLYMNTTSSVCCLCSWKWITFWIQLLLQVLHLLKPLHRSRWFFVWWPIMPYWVLTKAFNFQTFNVSSTFRYSWRMCMSFVIMEDKLSHVA
jgi:hypothetical protein